MSATPGPQPSGDPARPGPDPSGQAVPGQYPWSQAGPGPHPSGGAGPGRYPSGQAAPGPYPSGQQGPGGYPSGQAGPGPYPSGPGAAPGPRPSSVRVAVVLMWVGAALSLIGLLTAFGLQDDVRDMVADQLASQGTPISPELVEATVTVTLAIAVVSGLLGTGLWILNAVFCGRGAGWARILATVLGGFYLVNALFSLTQPSPAVSKLLVVLNVAVSVGAVVFLWLKPSSDWFRAVRGATAPAGYGPPTGRA